MTYQKKWDSRATTKLLRVRRAIQALRTKASESIRPESECDWSLVESLLYDAEQAVDAAFDEFRKEKSPW